MKDNGKISPSFTNQVVVFSPHLLFQEVGDEGVLLDLKSDTFFGLNATGCRIWKALQQCVELDMVVEQLIEEFNVEGADIGGDVHRLVEELVTVGLVTLTTLDNGDFCASRRN